MRLTSRKKMILSYFEPDNLEWVASEIGAPPFDVSGVAYLLHGMVSSDKRHQLESTRRTLESMVAGGANGSRGGGKQGIPPQPYNETAVIGIVADTIREGFDNGRIIAERLNEAGYQTKAGNKRGIRIFTAPGSVRGTMLRR